MFVKAKKLNFLFRPAAFAAVLVGLAGCNSTNNLETSASNGQFSSDISNSLASGILGGKFGNSMDKKSMKNALQAEYSALEKGRSGFPVPWTGSSGIAGKVIPQQPYQVGSTNCRRYEHVLQDRGTISRAIGTACRNSNGAWVPLT